MSLINWLDEYAVGIESVDHEHQELIALINDLHDAMQDNASTQQVLETLREIHAQFAAHFALEENIMRSMRYRAYQEHKEDHDILLEDLLEIMDEVEADESYNSAQLSNDLKRWFIEHFHAHDAKLQGAEDSGRFRV